MKGCLAVIGGLFLAFVGGVILLVMIGSTVKSSSTSTGVSISSSDSAAPTSASPSRSEHDLKLDAIQSGNQASGIDSTWGLIQVGKAKIVDADYGQRIEGTVENDTGHDLGYAEVDYRISDIHHAQIDSVMTNTLHLAAGSRWHYSIPIHVEQQYYWQMVEMTGR